MDSVVSIAYFPPVQFFKTILFSQNIYIEANENYLRQTYRNRCNILSCNGVLHLIIPIIKSESIKQNILDVKIDNSVKWQNLHIKSIISAYRKSPYFQYYSDIIFNLINFNSKYLFEYNYNILQQILKIYSINLNISLTNSFLKKYEENKYLDIRYSLTPKKELKLFNESKYIQTFSDRFSFVPNLSILDLIFNTGTDCITLLKTKTTSITGG